MMEIMPYSGSIVLRSKKIKEVLCRGVPMGGRRRHGAMAPM